MRMKCVCGAWTRTLQTRDRANGTMVRRRLECANGHRFTTLEIQAEALIKLLPPKQLEDLGVFPAKLGIENDS